jgi:hypothetical protein
LGRTATTTGLKVKVSILDKVYETGRKYAAGFTKTMKTAPLVRDERGVALSRHARADLIRRDAEFTRASRANRLRRALDRVGRSQGSVPRIEDDVPKPVGFPIADLLEFGGAQLVQGCRIRRSFE